MKHLTCILLLIIISFSACRQDITYPSAMLQAEALMNTRPDSALILLESIEDTLATLPEEARMYHQLLTIQAKDKQYITHTDDSLINRIVSFYENYGNNDRLMMAYFYQGSTYRDMNDAPRALKAFQQAVDLNVPNFDLLAKAYNQMGNLFMYQGLHDEVIRVNRKAIEAYLALGKKNKISYFQRDIARMYDVKNMPDSALFYYKKACNTALTDGDSTRYYGISSELGGYYLKTGNHVDAKQMLLKYEKQHLYSNKTHIYLNLGNIYEKAQLWDSAYHYYQKALSEGDTRRKCYAYYALAWMEHHRGNITKAMKYMNQYIPLKDSIDQMMQTETVSKINALYNYQHTSEENASLRLEQEKQRNRNLLISILLFFVILTACSIIVYLKKKNREALRIECVLKRMEEDRYNRSLSKIKENEQTIVSLQRDLGEIKNHSGYLQRELSVLQKEMLELHNREILHANNEEEERIATFQQSSLYNLLQRAASCNDDMNISEIEWERIRSTLDFVFPHFRKQLIELYPQLSKIEEQVCWLIKLSIPPAGIARIVKRSNSAISNIRTRLHKKIHKTDGNGEMFDEFIRKL